jgi:dephospho-CoA kinase
LLAIALTGGIGAGKSSAGSLLARLGALHISADQLAREILERGESGFNQVVAQFGDEILVNGYIDRGKLAEIIFSDPKKKEILEEITHPLIAERFKEIRKELPEHTVLVYEIPLLAENPERVNEFDIVLTIETSTDNRIERLKNRGISEEAAKSRMATQTSDEHRRAIAHHVIENNGDMEALLAQLEQWWDDFIAPRIAN